jgi:hypothetical protein
MSPLSLRTSPAEDPVKQFTVIGRKAEDLSMCVIVVHVGNVIFLQDVSKV